MTNLITEARELCERTVPAPWRTKDRGDYIEIHDNNTWAKSLSPFARVEGDEFDSADFIARSRTLIPELCDALEKAEGRNRQLVRELSALARESVERDMALARLEAEVMAMRDSVRWISVAERLPEPNVDTLVLTDAGSIRQGYIGHATGHWCSGGFVMVPSVTHWMPLPAPPEEGAEHERD